MLARIRPQSGIPFPLLMLCHSAPAFPLDCKPINGQQGIPRRPLQLFNHIGRQWHYANIPRKNVQKLSHGEGSWVTWGAVTCICK